MEAAHHRERARARLVAWLQIAACVLAASSFALLWDAVHAKRELRSARLALAQACESAKILAPAVWTIPPIAHPDPLLIPFLTARDRMAAACLIQ